jgi:hypothetical protein
VTGFQRRYIANPNQLPVAFELTIPAKNENNKSIFTPYEMCGCLFTATIKGIDLHC